MVRVIVLIISVIALALIVRFVFKLRGVGEAVEIDLRDIEGGESDKSSAAAKSKDITEAIRDGICREIGISLTRGAYH